MIGFPVEFNNNQTFRQQVFISQLYLKFLQSFLLDLLHENVELSQELLQTDHQLQVAAERTLPGGAGPGQQGGRDAGLVPAVAALRAGRHLVSLERPLAAPLTRQSALSPLLHSLSLSNLQASTNIPRRFPQLGLAF